MNLTDEQIKEIKEHLKQIRDKIGPFKVDAQQFAWSVMESSTEHAIAILEILARAEASAVVVVKSF